MHKIWSAKIGWDALVPEEIYPEWQRFQQQLPLIIDIRLPRWIGFARNQEVSLHSFADASALAFGAELYALVVLKNLLNVFLSLPNQGWRH